jgi:hypothetical protein
MGIGNRTGADNPANISPACRHKNQSSFSISDIKNILNTISKQNSIFTIGLASQNLIKFSKGYFRCFLATQLS